jgi:hypothetical protein
VVVPSIVQPPRSRAISVSRARTGAVQQHRWQALPNGGATRPPHADDGLDGPGWRPPGRRRRQGSGLPGWLHTGADVRDSGRRPDPRLRPAGGPAPAPDLPAAAAAAAGQQQERPGPKGKGQSRAPLTPRPPPGSALPSPNPRSYPVRISTDVAILRYCGSIRPVRLARHRARIAECNSPPGNSQPRASGPDCNRRLCSRQRPIKYSLGIRRSLTCSYRVPSRSRRTMVSQYSCRFHVISRDFKCFQVLSSAFK